ncbi:MAG TPA: hypothetical protein VD907_02260 [Verrucomicrobiae bacterium]|nr:hypothetical protein [Verrucomicrobiae bacterium]
MTDYIIGFSDGPNADNQAMHYGALRAFQGNPRFQFVGVIVDPTAVNYEDQPLGSRNIELSRRVHLLHTARMAGLFRRAGSSVKVFRGLDITQTAATSPIPHSAHTKHHDYDVFGDAPPKGQGFKAIAGDFTDARRFIRGLNGTVHLVIGGQFSSVAKLIEDPVIFGKLGILACQAGFKLSQRAIYSQMSFNLEVDLRAALEVYLHYPQAMYFVPSDITRDPKVTFTGADELARLGVQGEILEIFRRHRERTAERHAKQQLEDKKLKAYPPLSIHDLQAVFALRQALGLEANMYQFAPIDPDEAIRNTLTTVQHWAGKGIRIDVSKKVVAKLGYTSSGMLENGHPLPPRYVVTDQNAELYKRRVPEVLR